MVNIERAARSIHPRKILYTIDNIILYFLKYSRSKLYAVEHNLCISGIIRASKLRGSAVSAKINTPRKLSVAKVNKCEREFA